MRKTSLLFWHCELSRVRCWWWSSSSFRNAKTANLESRFTAMKMYAMEKFWEGKRELRIFYRIFCIVDSTHHIDIDVILMLLEVVYLLVFLHQHLIMHENRKRWNMENSQSELSEFVCFACSPSYTFFMLDLFSSRFRKRRGKGENSKLPRHSKS